MAQSKINFWKGVSMIKNALKENVTQEKTNIYYSYLQILHEELIPAMGCTEPISLAYAAAKARCILGDLPDKIDVIASGNIIKNVKSVVVPNTNGLKYKDDEKLIIAISWFLSYAITSHTSSL